MSKKEETFRSEFQLNKKDISYIETIMEKHILQKSQALSRIISEHKEPEVEKRLNEMDKKINNNKTILNRLDKNMSILLEIMNSISIQESYEIFVPTSEFESELFKESKKEVEKKINKQVIKYLDKRIDN